MIRELLESLKYVGHYFAICFLRVYVGLHLLNLGLSKYYGNYLHESIISSQIYEFLNDAQSPVWINYFFQDLVTPYWFFFSNLQVGLEIGAGVLLIIGFLVRPVVIVLMLYFWIFSYIQPENLWPWMGLLSATLLCLGWAGAGRCVGLDYYFYKRYRGFLW